MIVFKMSALFKRRLMRIAKSKTERERMHIRNALALTAFLNNERRVEDAKVVFTNFCQKVN